MCIEIYFVLKIDRKRKEICKKKLKFQRVKEVFSTLKLKYCQKFSGNAKKNLLRLNDKIILYT